MVGDSKLWATGRNESLPALLQRALWRHRGGVRHLAVHALSWPALGIAGHYCLVDEVLAPHPDRVVFELNLQLWGPAPPGFASFPELAGLIHGSRLWEAAWLPLSYTGITLNRLLSYRLLIDLGLEDEWAALVERQGRIFDLRASLDRRLERAIDGPTGLGTTAWLWSARLGLEQLVVAPGARPRDSRLYAEQQLGNVLRGVDPSSPRVRVFAALLDDYRRAGVPLLVWTTPLNVDHLRALGYSLDGLDRTIATFRSMTEASGATFVDFHARFPDAAFLDPGDHFTTAGKSSAAHILGGELAAAVAKMRGRHP